MAVKRKKLKILASHYCMLNMHHSLCFISQPTLECEMEKLFWTFCKLCPLKSYDGENSKFIIILYKAV